MTSADKLKQIDEILWPPGEPEFELEPRDLRKINDILFEGKAPAPDTAEDRTIIKLREVLEKAKTDADALEDVMWVMEDYRGGRMHNPRGIGWTPILVSAGLTVVGVVGFVMGYRERKKPPFHATLIPPF